RVAASVSDKRANGLIGPPRGGRAVEKEGGTSRFLVEARDRDAGKLAAHDGPPLVRGRRGRGRRVRAHAASGADRATCCQGGSGGTAVPPAQAVTRAAR